MWQQVALGVAAKKTDGVVDIPVNSDRVSRLVIIQAGVQINGAIRKTRPGIEDIIDIECFLANTEIETHGVVHLPRIGNIEGRRAGIACGGNPKHKTGIATGGRYVRRGNG